MSDTFEIVLRISGGSDYCTFEIEDPDSESSFSTLKELEFLICDALSKKFNLEDCPDD